MDHGFLKSAVLKIAPNNDWNIIDGMKLYQETNPDLALSVLNAMQGQAWYLTLPFVGMALADDDISTLCFVAHKLSDR